MLKGEFENNSRMPRDQVKKWHSNSLKKFNLLFLRVRRRKGDKIADDEDDDAVKTSVSQDRVTAVLCAKELFLSTQYTSI